MADMACCLAGLVSFALYPRAPIDRVIRSAKEAACRLVLTDNPVMANALKSQHIGVVLLCTSGHGDTPCVYDLMAAPLTETDSLAGLDESGPFTIVSTSGTLSEPKLFSVRAEPLLRTIGEFQRLYRLSSRDSLLLCLPLAHLPQRMLLYGSLALGMDIILSTPRRLIVDASAFQPSVIVTVPKLLDFIAHRIQERTRLIFGGLGVSTLAVLQNLPGRPLAALFGWMRRNIFGRRLRLIFVGSAPSSIDTLKLLLSVGFPIYEVYGTTELGIVAVNSPGLRRVGTVGQPLRWCDVRLEDQTKEIQVRTAFPFRHQWLAPRQNDLSESGPEGFEGTGDIGHIDREGYLAVMGRCRDFVPLDSGEKIFVAGIERKVETIGSVDSCVVSGDGKSRLKATIFLRDGVANSPENELADLLRRELAIINSSLHPWERLYGFCLVRQPPTVESGCLTETMKIRRLTVIEQYGNLGLHVI